jgi:hypothetical protein
LFLALLSQWEGTFKMFLFPLPPKPPAGAKLTWEYVVDVGAYSSLVPGNIARKELDATGLMK